jgi:hypothetical protein
LRERMNALVGFLFGTLGNSHRSPFYPKVICG